MSPAVSAVMTMAFSMVSTIQASAQIPAATTGSGRLYSKSGYRIPAGGHLNRISLAVAGNELPLNYTFQLCSEIPVSEAAYLPENELGSGFILSTDIRLDI